MTEAASNSPLPKNHRPEEQIVISGTSKCALVAAVITGVAGAVIVVLGGIQLFGPVDSIWFIASITSGGTAILLSIGGSLWIIHKSYTKEESVKGKPSTLGNKIEEEQEYKQPASNPNPPPPSNSVTPESNSNPPVTPESQVNDLYTKYDSDMRHINELRILFQSEITWDNFTNYLRNIPKEHFSNPSQERAKFCFTEAMYYLLGSEVEFPKVGSCPLPVEAPTGDLHQDVFQYSPTIGVYDDISRSAQDDSNVHVIAVDSNYSSGVTTGRYTVAPGNAYQAYQNGGTVPQGFLAKITDPYALELETAFLTNHGFNMLHEVLPGHSTYTPGSLVEHGFLYPLNKDIKSVTESFKQNFSKTEYVCYTSKMHDWKNTIYLFSMAAPAISYEPLDPMEEKLTSNSDELQKINAFAATMAFFRYGITLSQQKWKPIVLHYTMIGESLGNSISNIAWGFKHAALLMQDEMCKSRVHVQIEASSSYTHTGELQIDPRATDFAITLGVPRNLQRIGEPEPIPEYKS